MRVGIITLGDFSNYGNRLQNYALQRVIEKQGFECVSYVSFRPVFFKEMIKSILKNDEKLLQYKWLELERLHNFLRFDKKYVNTIETRTSCFNEKLDSECDYFVVGSDQIWNPDWAEYLYENAFLRFTKLEKRIAYSPSFGVDSIPENLIQKYREGLQDFASLSVREDKGAQIIENLIQKDVKVLTDPTLLLSSEEWINISKKPTGFSMKGEYILQYFLGETTKDQKETIERLEEEYNCSSLCLLDKNNPLIYVSGPSEFIFLIKNAKLIITDSFHACVFSFLFDKPFIVYPRKGNMEGMMSRISTLLSKYHLERKYAFSGLKNDILECNYGEGKKQLIIEQKKAINFLKDAFKIN